MLLRVSVCFSSYGLYSFIVNIVNYCICGGCTKSSLSAQLVHRFNRKNILVLSSVPWYVLRSFLSASSSKCTGVFPQTRFFFKFFFCLSVKNLHC